MKQDAGSGGGRDSGAGDSATDGAGAEAPVPTEGLMLWLRADRGLMLHNGFVEIWQDQSDNHLDAIQTASDVQPLLIQDGIGGQPSLEFDGIDDFMKLPAGFDDFSQGISIFATVQRRSSDSCSAIVEASNGTEIDDISFGQNLNLQTYEVFDQYIEGDEIPPDTPQLLAVIHNPSHAVELRRNGTLSAEGMFEVPAVILREQGFLGRSLYVECLPFAGRIAELLIYSRAVTDMELLKIEAYMRMRSNCCDG